MTERRVVIEVPGTFAAHDLAERLRPLRSDVTHEERGVAFVTTDEPVATKDLVSLLEAVTAWAAGWDIATLPVRFRQREYELRPPRLNAADATDDEIAELLAIFDREASE